MITRSKPAKPNKPKPTPPPSEETPTGHHPDKPIPAWKKLKLARQKQQQKFNPRTQTQNLRRSFIGMRRGER